MKTLKITLLFAACAFASIFAGCSDDGPTKMFTFHIGNSRSIASKLSRSEVTMPMSGFKIVADNDYFMYSGDIERVDWSYCQMEDGSKISGLTFKCNDRGKRRLMQTSAANMGGYLVVKYDDNPVGLRKIDCTMSDGTVFFISEIPESSDVEIGKLLDEMNQSIANINKIADESRL